MTANRTAQIDEAGTLALTAEARTSAGAVLPSASFTWTSLDAGVASVSTAGVVTAVAPGTAHILVTSATVATATPDTAVVTVVAIPVARVALVDTLLPAAFAVGDQVSWSSSASSSSSSTNSSLSSSK